MSFHATGNNMPPPKGLPPPRVGKKTSKERAKEIIKKKESQEEEKKPAEKKPEKPAEKPGSKVAWGREAMVDVLF